MSFKIVMCFFLAMNSAAFGKIPKVVGGMDANIVDFPYIASLRRVSIGLHVCGGAIISDRHVLTAAHCVYQDFVPYSDINLFVGTDTISDESVTPLQIKHIFVHYAFTGRPDIMKNYLNDIALIKVVEAIEFNEFQTKINLPTEDVINSEIGIFAGWGTKTYPSIITSNKLQQILMRIFDVNNCDPFLPFKMNSDQFCGFNSQGIGVCIGDSGSPLTYNGILIGISSISVPCATGIPDLFTNVYAHLDFITKYLEK